MSAVWPWPVIGSKDDDAADNVADDGRQSGGENGYLVRILDEVNVAAHWHRSLPAAAWTDEAAELAFADVLAEHDDGDAASITTFITCFACENVAVFSPTITSSTLIRTVGEQWRRSVDGPCIIPAGIGSSRCVTLPRRSGDNSTANNQAGMTMTVVIFLPK